MVANVGQTCGVTDAVADKPYFYTVITAGVGVCVANCPAETASFTSIESEDYFCLESVRHAVDHSPLFLDLALAQLTDDKQLQLPTATLAPQASPTKAPKASPTSAPIASPTLAPIATPTAVPSVSPTTSSPTRSDPALSFYIENFCFKNGQFSIASNCGCMLKIESNDELERCVFANESIADDFATQKVKSQVSHVFADLMKSKSIILGYGLGLAVALGFIWLFVLQFEWISTIFVWVCIAAVQAVLILLTVIAYKYVEEWKSQSPPVHTDKQVIFLCSW